MRPKLDHLKKIRVGAVSYLNTRPFLYGIKQHNVINDIDLIEDYPSRVAQMLINDKIDVGLIPVAAIPQLSEHHIVSNYCIGADGPVASVGIFSDLPIEQLKNIYLDYQSKTSVNLAKILLKDFWNKEVNFLPANSEDFRSSINGDTGAVLIGDRALEQRSKSKYVYDLGEAWKKYTGLPFVFAAWVANKPLPPDFVPAFNEANKWGLERLEVVLQNINYPVYDLKKYFTQNISYLLDAEKRKGLALFMEKLAQ